MGHKLQKIKAPRMRILGALCGTSPILYYWFATESPRQPTDRFEPLLMTARSCSPEEAVQNANYFISSGYDQSNCPDDIWLEDLERLEPLAPERLFVNVGVNKGYNLLRWINIWRPDIKICPSDWHDALDVPEDEACGSCSDCQKPCYKPSLFDTDAATHDKPAHPRVTMVGMDPNNFTLASLEQAVDRLGLRKTPGVSVDLVLGAAGDKEGEVTLNAFCGKNGNQVCAIQTDGDGTAFGRAKVPMFTVDGLMNGRKGSIDILHVDTEGYDPNASVIKGGLETLRRGRIRLLSFEYHTVGLWKDLSLKAVTTLLDDAGYDCWFQGQRRLFRITGCYVPHWEFQAWSNVVCARRGDSYHSVLTKYEFWYNAPAKEADRRWLPGQG